MRPEDFDRMLLTIGLPIFLDSRLKNPINNSIMSSCDRDLVDRIHQEDVGGRQIFSGLNAVDWAIIREFDERIKN